MAYNVQGLLSGGGFETRLPERLPIYITDVELLTNVQ
jgi:hypothetical protein